MPHGFKREQLSNRYDVSTFHEDEWHTYAGRKTLQYVAIGLGKIEGNDRWLLNAGAGVYEFRLAGWREIALDLFSAPLGNRKHAVCGTVEALPFGDSTLGAILCVGEVLGYSDPIAAFQEFARVLQPKGLMICDFSSSRSFRHLLRKSYGRAADIAVDYYNRSSEQIWVYDPKYIAHALSASGFEIRRRFGTHTWSALALRFGIKRLSALTIEEKLGGIRFLNRWGDVTTIVAART